MPLIAQSLRARDILEKCGTVNIDEREASWRRRGSNSSVGRFCSAAGAGVSCGYPVRRVRKVFRAEVGEEAVQGVEEKLGSAASGRSGRVEGPELRC